MIRLLRSRPYRPAFTVCQSSRGKCKHCNFRSDIRRAPLSCGDPPNNKRCAVFIIHVARSYSSVDEDAVADRVSRLLEAKAASGKTFDNLANELGLSNVYTAQLLLGQARLSEKSATKLKQALPSVSDEDIECMTKSFPMRNFDDDILKEPNVYRTYEAITHNGEAIKSIINEQCGDGIMSAIDFYCDVGTVTGKHGEKRVIITFNGKFLPYSEQIADDNVAPSPRG